MAPRWTVRQGGDGGHLDLGDPRIAEVLAPAQPRDLHIGPQLTVCLSLNFYWRGWIVAVILLQLDADEGGLLGARVLDEYALGHALGLPAQCLYSGGRSSRQIGTPILVQLIGRGRCHSGTASDDCISARILLLLPLS